MIHFLTKKSRSTRQLFFYSSLFKKENFEARKSLKTYRESIKMCIKVKKGSVNILAYQFSNQAKASAFVHKYGETSTYKIAGVNGEQTNADNFHTAITGLLHVVGKDTDAATGMGRTISQDVEDVP